MSAHPKDGDLLCEAWLDFVRDLSCCFCPAELALARRRVAHHYPLRGRGTTRDDKTIPVCDDCHDRCHGIPVVRAGIKLEPIPEHLQAEAVRWTRLLFLDLATSAQFAAFELARSRWIQSRGGEPPAIPF